MDRPWAGALKTKAQKRAHGKAASKAAKIGIARRSKRSKSSCKYSIFKNKYSISLKSEVLQGRWCRCRCCRCLEIGADGNA